MQKKDSEMLSVGHIEINATDFTAQVNLDAMQVLATRNLVLFPGVTYPINIVRPASRRLALEAERRGVAVAVVCQTDPEVDNPTVADLQPLGVVAQVLKVLELPDDTCLAIVHAREKIAVEPRTDAPASPGEHILIKAVPVAEAEPRRTDTFTDLVETLWQLAERAAKNAGPGGGPMAQMAMDQELRRQRPTLYVNHICTTAPLSVQAKMELLECGRVRERAHRLKTALLRAEHQAQLMQEMRERAKQSMSERQRAAFLETQIDEMRKELYGDAADDDTDRLREKIEALELPDSTREALMREWRKLTKLNPQSPDYQVQCTYLETVTDLPWGFLSDDNWDFDRARRILDADHSGLEKVKERVVEQLALLKHNPGGHAPILCLVGPPGVGKTSLGQSIAKAMGRKFQRVSLGGLHDESEIRGHRRTYIGAMPGRIVEALKRAGTANPVIMLDEIDKVGADYKGDPAAALLEVLDPEQNSHFHDNYVNLDFDLSKVTFITTANTLSTLSQPLIDRMEVVMLSGYSQQEKVGIAREHLIPTLMRELNLQSSQVSLPDATVEYVIENYTSESGVRQLQKRLGSIMRKRVLELMEGRDFTAEVDVDTARRMLGVEPVSRDKYGTDSMPGVVTGLAWTQAGGEILYIEALLTPGKGEQLTLTGNLGNVMKESAAIARRYVQAHAESWGIDPERLKTSDIHIHVPEGAIPKDGPSAGITMTTAIVSALTGRPVRPNWAMTGEMTLRGRVLPVGGIKEKMLAAKRAGITDIIMSELNRKNVEDIPQQYRAGLTFHYVNTIDQVTGLALEA